MPAIVRRATRLDLEPILDLLTEYDLPRAYFEPFYYQDPTYRPEHSWLVEVDGQLAAHLRIYDRWIYVHGAPVHIAGLGNVITTRAFRGQGLAGQLLRAVTREAPDAGFVYSLLWTHLPAMYERYGWAPIDQEAIHASISTAADPHAVHQYNTDDLPDVMRLYEETNHVRSGPTVRSADYWRAQLAWTREDPDGFLVTRGTGGSLTGYVRSRGGPSGIEVIELGAAPAGLTCGRALVESVARRQAGEIDAQLPPSLYDVFPRASRQVAQIAGLMGRVLDVRGLLTALESVLVQRAPAAGWLESAHSLATNLTERDLGHLLFHGYDEVAAKRLGHRQDAEALKALFPAQDFVIWPSDAF